MNEHTTDTIDVADVDMWDLWEQGSWVVVPTNTQTRRDGTAVMGAGVAKAAAARFDGLEVAYGSALRAGRARVAYPQWRVLCVPTKRHWRDPSRLDDVAEALDGIAVWADRHPDAQIACPALGCGLGGLDFELVRSLAARKLTGRNVTLIPPH